VAGGEHNANKPAQNQPSPDRHWPNKPRVTPFIPEKAGFHLDQTANRGTSPLSSCSPTSAGRNQVGTRFVGCGVPAKMLCGTDKSADLQSHEQVSLVDGCLGSATDRSRASWPHGPSTRLRRLRQWERQSSKPGPRTVSSQTSMASAIDVETQDA
jgi:hypothetical protein